MPRRSRGVLADMTGFLENGIAIRAVLLATMLIFSSLAPSRSCEKPCASSWPHHGSSQRSYRGRDRGPFDQLTAFEEAHVFGNGLRGIEESRV